jgi:hypothetical protein
MKISMNKKITIPATDEINLALSWARGEITIGQVKDKLGKRHAQAYYIMAKSLRFYLLMNELNKKVEKPEANQKKLTFYDKRKCLYCPEPIADQESKSKKFCSVLCKSRHHKSNEINKQ